ncbi:hypothetical protein AWM70_20090 [Paenibacillus yonginensis]|uniref:Uncharacterized protein n=1 Tax=Paenibacillus yonginensis TaxID=1462996 RepID=A0A1B1N5A5_9BACL|nr:hypothetical protein [Paenibacillus yonginensis]ANS76592.1 hypothetical protein AWM70_20090 [Paenibacillus yonginensis]
MKKNFLIKCIVITALAVLFSNLIQFYLTNHNLDKTSATQELVNEEKSSIFTNYSSRIQSAYRFLLAIESQKYNRPNEAYLFSQGYLMGSSSDYYSYLEMLIKKMDSSEYHYELNNIIETNKNLQSMIYQLNKYLFTQKDARDFPERWEQVKVLLKTISSKLWTQSTNDLSLYNITSYPKEFIARSAYTSAMASLNQDITEVIGLVGN